MKKLGLVLHWHKDEVIALAMRVLGWCQENAQIEVSLPERDASLIGREDLSDSTENFGEGLDLCVSIGGDGTILHAVSLVSKYNVPILGVNQGNLGYLTEVDAENLESALTAWINGDIGSEDRMMIQVQIPSLDNSHESQIFHCLNEVVLYRSQSGRSMSLGTQINGENFLSYVADGIVLATPTGSTAYSLSAGGPIVEPGFEALILSPVAAHTAFNRSMVLPPTSEVVFVVEGYRPAEVTVDGRTVAHLDPGDRIVCTASEQKARFLRSNSNNFHSVLKDKFGIKNIH